jgi:hypothetical protein
MPANSWMLLVLSLPSRHATSRMRVWRALKSLGAGVLRDGVYLLPDQREHRESLEVQARAVRATGGAAYLIGFESGEEETANFRLLFDRGADYQEWRSLVQALRKTLAQMAEPDARRQWAQLSKQFHAIVATDFFPGIAHQEALRTLEETQTAFNRQFSPDEPVAAEMSIHRRKLRDYQGRVWATRARPWVDRLASGWLIRRFIDPAASFSWLTDIKSCPAQVVGFDFDGAEFTHVGERVTFEVLMESFGLQQDRALQRLAALVHFLDVGGTPVPEAAGLTSLLTGMRARLSDDDTMQQEASRLLDDLYAAYQAAL